jgi:hypothetical protein
VDFIKILLKTQQSAYELFDIKDIR